MTAHHGNRTRPPRRSLRLALVLVLAAGQFAPGGFGNAQQGPPAGTPHAQSGGASGGGSKLAVDEGLWYYADGRKVGLLRRTDQIVVSLRTPPGIEAGRAADTAIARLTRPGGPLNDFVQARALAPNLRVLQNPAAARATTPPGLARNAARMQAAIAQAKTSPDVEWAVSVYANEETGTLQVVADEVIVALDRGADPAAFFGSDARFAGYRPLVGTDDQFVATVAGGAGEAAIELANEISKDARVAWASPNFYQALEKHSVNDPLFGIQWHLENTGQFGGTPDGDVDALDAWAIAGGGSPDIVVAIVDDGMEYSHPDLAPNLFVNEGEIPANGVDDDGNGWIDDVNGWDFTSNDNFPGASSINDAHATSVGGVTAAAGNNSQGVSGIAYNSRLLPVRIFGDTGSATTDANIASAVYYAAGRTANGLGSWRAGDILNNSWGGGAASSAITAAFTWASTNGRNGKGAPSFIATGNGFASSISYPANLAGTISGVIAVGASTNLEVRASYSNYGPQIDFVAPSNGPTYGGTYGIVTVDRVGNNGYSNQDYTVGGEFGGTSSATPLAAGIGALILAMQPDMTAVQLRALMRANTELIGPIPYVNGFNTQYGYGRVNAFNSVRYIGHAEVQVFDGGTELTSGATAGGFSALLSQTATRTYIVRNQGTADLHLGSLNVASGPFSIVNGFADTTLSIGESTTFTVGFTPTTGGVATAALSFTTNDDDESVFALTLSGTAIVTSIAGHVFEDWNGDGARAAGEPGLGGWTVFLDQNNNGALDSETYTASPNQAIPDNNPAGITSSVVVGGVAAPVSDVDVRVNITHTWAGDLELRLISPSGTVVPLALRRGGSGDNFVNTIFDDQAPTAISAGAAPFTGRFRPESPLAALVGQQANGSWQLRVSDHAGLDTGTLLNWSLIVTTEQSAVTDSAGFYAFTNLPADTYTVRRVLQGGWNATGPMGDAYLATVVDENTALLGRDFGQVRQHAIYGHEFNDLDGNGVRGVGEPGAAGWTVFLDRNNDGIFSPTAAFTASPNLPIPDNNITGITSTQAVAGLDSISDVDVRINITHTFVGDLEVRLVSPAGTIVPLILRRGGSGDNFTNTTLDDEAATSITSIASAGAPFTGRFRPESPLSALDGQDPNGTWELRVADRVGLDVGVLVNWTLLFEREASVVTPASGNYVFANVPAGTHRVRQVNQAGWRPTAPASGVHQISLPPLGSAVGNDFGNVADLVPPTADIVDVTPDPRTTPVSSVTINFSEAVTGFDLSDLSLTRDGDPVALVGASITGGGASYVLQGLGPLTMAAGSYVLTLTAAGSGIADLAQNALAGDASDSWTTQKSATQLLYTGTQIVNVGASFTPSAKLTSPMAACVPGQTITFALDANPLNGAAGEYVIGTAVTNGSGIATAPSVSTAGWLEGVYTLTASFAGNSFCLASHDEATFTVASPGSAATGGGWYTVPAAGRVNFGFTVRRVPNTETYRGQIVVINNGKWRLKGQLDTYAKTGGSGASSGVGDLFWWNPDLNGGLGDWALAQAGVSFTASFTDSGKAGKNSTDAFGIRIVYLPVPPQPGTLPNSAPTVLKGGDIKVN